MPHTDSTFDRLKDAVGEMIAVEAGKQLPVCEHIYDGAVLVEIREEGKVVWRSGGYQKHQEK